MDTALALHPMQRPYPLLSLLAGSALLRADIAAGCPGVPLALTLRFVAAGPLAQALPHAAVYLWHCDARGLLHDERDDPGSAASDRLGRLTRLRGVQVSDATGQVRFRTIYPGPHIDGRALLHLQIYLSDAVQVTGMAHTSLVLPQAETLRVHARRSGGPGPIGLGWLAAGAPTPGPLLDGIALDGNPSTGYAGRLTIALRLPSPSPTDLRETA